MKISIDIDCTPQEARAFFGLPDVGPLQDALMKEVQDRMTATLRTMDPDVLFKTWMPGGLQGLEQLQKAFWRQFEGQGERQGGRPGEGPGGRKDAGS